MKHSWILGTAVMACLSLSSDAFAQMRTVRFDLENILLLPNVSHPGYPAQPMRGSFEWTYRPGDFENGSARFTSIYIPWDQPNLDELITTVEPTSMEFNLNQSWHDRGIDVTLHLAEPFSPGGPAPIDLDRSKFEIQRGITYQGHVISGSVNPVGGVNCELISKMKTRCANGKLTVKVKSSMAEGTQLTIDNDGEYLSMTLNRKGKGKVKFKNQGGRRHLSIVECPEQHSSVNCG